MYLISLLLTLMTVTTSLVSATRRPYIAATYEHARFGKIDDTPSLVIEENLKMYKRAAYIASLKDADIILYPEYGIFYPGNRTYLNKYVEFIPNPKNLRINPCDEVEDYFNRPILRTLSCIAKHNSIFVVANTGDIQNCSGDPDCREDGVYIFNTNVVFDRDGTLLLKYHKEHLFLEEGMDTPKEQQTPIFETDFGTFATYICFDISFKRMGEVAQWPQVDGIMFATMWFDSTPQYPSVPFWQGWAIGNNATLVASNLNIPNYSIVGSGIFYGKQGSLGYSYSPDGISKLITARIPVSGPAEPSSSTVTAFNDDDIWEVQEEDEVVPKTCSRTLLGDTDDTEEFRCFEENMSNYTLVRLTEPTGYAEACNNGVCCALRYSAENMSENFYLGVNNGIFNIDNKILSCLEDCFIARCDAIDGLPCRTFPRVANTLFHSIDLRANFSTQYVYPSVVSSNSRLVPMSEWRYGLNKNSGFVGSLSFRSKLGRHIINAGFKARCYDRDPIVQR